MSLFRKRQSLNANAEIQGIWDNDHAFGRCTLMGTTSGVYILHIDILKGENPTNPFADNRPIAAGFRPDGKIKFLQIPLSAIAWWSHERDRPFQGFHADSFDATPTDRIHLSVDTVAASDRLRLIVQPIGTGSVPKWIDALRHHGIRQT
jgi:hypothetical protein